jgi:SAM-dependent methyltransferase
MNLSFLKYLVDPKTGENLELLVKKEENGDVLEGELKSPSNTYLIVRGIPRFAGYSDNGGYAESFGFEWNKWPRLQFEDENIGRPMQGHTLKMWEQVTGQYQTNLTGKVIADFGCGPGRFLDIVRKKGSKVIGLDMSSAVEAAKKNFPNDPNVLICQADILQSPIKPGSMDGVFSIGVLHHTSSPQTGFKEMVKAAKSGAWVALAVYGPGGHYGDKLVNAYRRLFKKLAPTFGYWPPLIYTYFVTYCIQPFLTVPIFKYPANVLKLFFPFVNLPDVRWTILDTFDSITPSNQSSHSVYEVYHWFKDENLKNIEPSEWCAPATRAIK